MGVEDWQILITTHTNLFLIQRNLMPLINQKYNSFFAENSTH